MQALVMIEHHILWLQDMIADLKNELYEIVCGLLAFIIIMFENK